jgi:hypothetical protein
MISANLRNLPAGRQVCGEIINILIFKNVTFEMIQYSIFSFH